MKVEDYQLLDYKEKLLHDALIQILFEQEKQTKLLEEFVSIMKKADEHLTDS